jgi:hypothetical protein
MRLVGSATDLSVFILIFSNGAHADSASYFSNPQTEASIAVPTKPSLHSCTYNDETTW